MGLEWKDEGQLGVAIVTHESLPEVRIENLVLGRLQACWLGSYKILNVYTPAGANLGAQQRDFFSTSLLTR